jgi:2,3-dihydroxy-p-cumate/2,3-dihydroxybenzoate 3,4-dioxygenase
MVALEQLRYVRLPVDDLDHATDFAQRILGLELIDRTQDLATFRSDFRDYTLAFATGAYAVQSVGLEVRAIRMISTQRLMRCGGLACPPPEARRRIAPCARSRT